MNPKSNGVFFFWIDAKKFKLNKGFDLTELKQGVLDFIGSINHPCEVEPCVNPHMNFVWVEFNNQKMWVSILTVIWK